MLLTILLFACPEAAQTASLIALISIIVKPSISSSITLTTAKELIPNGCLENLSNKSVINVLLVKNQQSPFGALVAKTDSGIANVPPGTRKSTYSDEYMKATPFAKVTLESPKVADPTKPNPLD